ncbi:glycoside hydrolase [Crucibulum laeve]|uniref:alpha-1,2-Mannosidase n=1 Tax=Crucibulum laeve TaxID=68775 RepID=A0A5C3MLR2_9AGAR|nr:glycoside hydrolase [Crucibulum laeve]
MSLSDTRARKKQKKEKDAGAKPLDGSRSGSVKEKRKGDVTSDDSSIFQSFNTIILWGPLLLAVLAFAYMNPTVITELLDSWIGFSEHWDEPPTTAPENVTHLIADIPKRDAIVAAFKHAWHAYERDAMGDDEYHPLSRAGSNLTKAGGIGYTVVDSLDSMQIMGLHDEYTRAREWVETKLDFERDDTFSTFETTIRVLGGLLSSYHLSSHDPLYLSKAVELADRMLPAFDTLSGLPYPLINLAQRKGQHTTDFPGLVSIAEVATLQLEFRYLSEVTGDERYWGVVERVMQVVKNARLPHGMASVFLNVDEGQYVTSIISLGSRGDSFYEYLLKQYIQTNSTEDVYRDMYDDAMQAVQNYLIQPSKTARMIYTSELVPEQIGDGEITWRLIPKQDHLVCFLGGSLMLGATRTGSSSQKVSVPPSPGELTAAGQRDWKTGVELIKTCLSTHDTATGLAPEIVYFRIPSDGMDGFPGAPSDWYIKGAQKGVHPPYDARYMLRPETVESLFIAWRLTGDPEWRERGWKIFEAIKKWCKVEGGGYATVVNVDDGEWGKEDRMETFFLSETLKYLYLLFADEDVLPLDQYVFNTEAHPLPIFTPSIRTGVV